MRNAMSTMMEAIQSLSSRLDHVESRNAEDCLPVQNIPLILPVSSSFQVPPLVDPPDPGDWDDEGGDGAMIQTMMMLNWYQKFLRMLLVKRM